MSVVPLQGWRRFGLRVRSETWVGWWGERRGAGRATGGRSQRQKQVAFISTLEATQGQIDGFFSQLPCKCHQNRVASVEDRPQICPWVTSRVGNKLNINDLCRHRGGVCSIFKPCR